MESSMIGIPDGWRSTTYQWKSPALKLIAATKKLVYSSACERLYSKFSGDETTIGTRYWTDTSYFEI